MANWIGGWIPLVITLHILCCLPVTESARYGKSSKTIHIANELRNENTRTNVEAERRTSVEVNYDDVHNVYKRIRRNVDSSSSQNVASGMNISAVTLTGNHKSISVHWIGKSSSAIIVFSKYYNYFTKNSTVYLSRDYGKTFQNITSDVIGIYSSMIIDSIHISQQWNDYIVFTDEVMNCVIVTKDGCETFTRICNLPFTPLVVSFSPSVPGVFLILDSNSLNRGLYLSADHGQSFQLVKENVKSFVWGVQPHDPVNRLYVEVVKEGSGNVVWQTTDYFRTSGGDESEVVIDGVEDFEVLNEYMFATKKMHMLGAPGRLSVLQFWVSYNRGPFFNARFPRQHNHTDYYVADASEGQVMLCAVHNRSSTNLYISNYQGNDFSLSLEDVVYYNWEVAQSGSDLGKHIFADIHKVAGLKGIFIASQFISSLSDNGFFAIDNQRTLITYDKGGEWNLMDPPLEMYGKAQGCEKSKNCSLHLLQRFSHLSSNAYRQYILSRESAPGIIMASGVVGSNLTGETSLFVSNDAGVTWNQVMKGLYLFSMADHGGVLMATYHHILTKSLFYSVDEGRTWKESVFTKNYIYVFYLTTEPGEQTTVFTIVDLAPFSHDMHLYQVNVSGVLGSRCLYPEDYKDWSLPFISPSRGCLMGQRLVISRRVPHAVCYNGELFERRTVVRNCSCDRYDYECDFGYKTDSIMSHKCVRDDSVPDSMIHVVPSSCPAGSFYSFSRGYRRVAGDTCSGGESTSFDPSMYSCPVKERSEFLLVADSRKIQMLDIYDRQAGQYPTGETVFTIPTGNTGSRITAIAFDYQNNQLFFSTTDPSVIQSLSIDGKSMMKQLREGRVENVISMSLDWTADTLYWTDSVKRSIEVMRSNGSYHRRLIDNHPNVHFAERLTLNPKQGWMYWLDGDLLMQAHMSGTPESISVVARSSSTILGLAYDPLLSAIYYTNQQDEMFRIEISRMGKATSSVQVSLAGVNLELLFVSIYQENLVWYTGERNCLTMAPMSQPEVGVVVRCLPHQLIDMVAVTHQSQSGQSACSPPTTPCSQLCLPTPYLDEDASFNRTCRCGEEFSFTQMLHGNEKCRCAEDDEVIRDGYCVPATNGSSGARCGDDQFFCSKEDFCIPSSWVCDHMNDCDDMSDETDCGYYNCLGFLCDNGECIDRAWKCDEERDCPNGEDELKCVHLPCTTDQFMCQNKMCVNINYTCDQIVDCEDKSDEVNCSLRECHPWEFTCPDGLCIPEYSVCNGWSDCADGGDEIVCNTTDCHSHQFQCTNKQCIFHLFVCDSYDDCGDGSDEIVCNASSITTSQPHITSNRTCSAKEYRCSSGFCISSTSVCDGVKDCLNAEDEYNCYFQDTTMPVTSMKPTCGFHCFSGGCVPSAAKCDGHQDCRDNSDEFDCEEMKCDDGQFHCYMSNMSRGPRCIWESEVCNGHNDCTNSEDEINCNATHACPGNYFKCVTSSGCVKPEARCNGLNECFDESDEWDCLIEQCKRHGKNVERCCEDGCLYFDCGKDGINGCFPNTTLIDQYCFYSNGILCNGSSAPTNMSQPDVSKYYRCPSSDKWIPWMFVCNTVLDCANHGDENQCSNDDMTVYTVSYYSLQATFVVLTWQCSSFGRQCPVDGFTSFIVSFFPESNSSDWKNLTTSNQNYNLTGLSPSTAYVLAIYLVHIGEIHHPSPKMTFTTRDNSPGMPTQLRISVSADYGAQSVVVTWRPPPSGARVHYSVTAVDQGTQFITTRHTDQLSFRFYNLAPLHVYVFYVCAINDMGTSEPAAANFTYHPTRAIVAPAFSKVTVLHSSISLVWPSQHNAKSYRVTVRLTQQPYRHVIVSAMSNNVTVSGLCPGQTYGVSLELLFSANITSLPSDLLVVTLKGSPMTAPSEIRVQPFGVSSVFVHFKKPAIYGQRAVHVYYSKSQYFDEETFFHKSRNITTSSNSVQITDLNSCAKYFLSLCLDTDTCPDSGMTVFNTESDITSSPTHFRATVITSPLPIRVGLSWNAMCDQSRTTGRYLLSTVWTAHPHGQLSRLPSTATNDYNVTSLVRGEWYGFRLRTDYPGSRFSKTVHVEIPKFPAPEALSVVDGGNDTILIQWRNPPDDMPTSFLGYNVTVWQGSTLLDSRIVSGTNSIRIPPSCRSLCSVTVCFAFADDLNGDAATYYYSLYKPPNHSDGKEIVISKKNVLAVVIPVVAVILGLAAVAALFAVKHRRLQRSFRDFANSHYSTQTGSTTFVDDNDEPLIQGFADDEPLVIG